MPFDEHWCVDGALLRGARYNMICRSVMPRARIAARCSRRATYADGVVVSDDHRSMTPFAQRLRALTDAATPLMPCGRAPWRRYAFIRAMPPRPAICPPRVRDERAAHAARDYRYALPMTSCYRAPPRAGAARRMRAATLFDAYCLRRLLLRSVADR